MPKILVVDDERLVCEVLADFLVEWSDMEVGCAHDETLAAQKLRAGHFDPALIDATFSRAARDPNTHSPARHPPYW